MNADALPTAKFRLGHIVSTPNALAQLTQEDILHGIQRHQAGDWGDLNEEDRRANDLALVNGTRILSVYQAANGTKFWLVTESNRKVPQFCCRKIIEFTPPPMGRFLFRFERFRFEGLATPGHWL